MASFEEVVSKYIYITDEDVFKKPTGNAPGSSFDRLAASMAKRFPDKSINEIHRTLKQLEPMGITAAQYREQKLVSKASEDNPVRPSAIYALFKKYLPFKYRPLLKGQIACFYLAPSNELVKVTPADESGLLNSLKSLSEHYDSLYSAFESSEDFLAVRAKYSLPAALEVALKELLADPERRLNDEPPLLSWSSEQPAFRILDASVIQPGGTPTWDEFTSRLDFPDIFMAWVWTIFIPENFGRQIMWLKGSGYDGKSQVCDAIANFYGGEEFVATMQSKQTNFSLSQLYGKRLVLYNDCKDIRLHRKDDIKRLTGKDKTTVEFKNENPFAARVYAKLLVNSNWYPRIDFSQKSEHSRVIALEVAPSTMKGGDPTFQPRLESEMGAFLYKCREAHSMIFGDMVDLEPLPEDLLNKMVRFCESDESQCAASFIANRCDLNPNGEYLDTELQRDTREFMAEMQVSNRSYPAVRDSIEKRLEKLGVQVANVEHKGQKLTRVWQGISKRSYLGVLGV